MFTVTDLRLRGGGETKTKNSRAGGDSGSRAVPVEEKIRNNNNKFPEMLQLGLHIAGQAPNAL